MYSKVSWAMYSA